MVKQFLLGMYPKEVKAGVSNRYLFIATLFPVIRKGKQQVSIGDEWINKI